MRRLFGSLLILHAAAHAGAGVWVTGVRSDWTVTLLWFIATAGFLAAGIGLLGVARVERHWRPIVNVGAIASLGLLAMYAHPVFMVGAAIDGGILIGSIPFVRDVIARQIGVPTHPAHRHLSALGTAVALAFAIYASGTILLRPFHTSAGVGAVERTPSFLAVTLSPLNVLVFEPAHVIMETGIFQGIKARAERQSLHH